MTAMTLLEALGLVLMLMFVACVFTLYGLVLGAMHAREDTHTYVPREWCDDGDDSSVRHGGLGR